MKNVIRLHAVERQTSHSRLIIQISFFFRSTVAVASSTFRDYIKLSIHQQRAKHMHASLQACTVLRFLRLGGLEFTYYYRPRIFTASKVSIVNLLASYIFQNTQSLNT